MDKQELYNQMKSNGDIHRFRESPLWKQAFSLYTKHAGGGVSMSCNSCYKKVLKWLKKS